MIPVYTGNNMKMQYKVPHLRTHTATNTNTNTNTTHTYLYGVAHAAELVLVLDNPVHRAHHIL